MSLWFRKKNNDFSLEIMELLDNYKLWSNLIKDPELVQFVNKSHRAISLLLFSEDKSELLEANYDEVFPFSRYKDRKRMEVQACILIDEVNSRIATHFNIQHKFANNSVLKTV